MNYKSKCKKCRKQIAKPKSQNDAKNCSILETDLILRSKWTSDEDKKLIANVSLFGHRWLQVAQKMEQRNASQCCQRWKRLKKFHGVQQHQAKRWIQNEDQDLLRIFQQLGPCWKAIAKQMKNKTGQQVRRRYKNFLDPNLNHGPMTELEDERIYQEYLKFGTQWSKISRRMPGRSENMIKNRFYSCIKEKYLNQPNLYFKMKPLDESLKLQQSCIVEVFENDQFQPEIQDQYEEDLYSNSNEIMDNNQSRSYWSIETRCLLHKKN